MGNEEDLNSDNEAFDYKDVPDLNTDVKQEILYIENLQPIKQENGREDFIAEQNDFLSEQERILVKTEIKEELIDCKDVPDIVFTDGKIKEEELDIKEENIEQSETRQNDFLSEQEGILVKTEIEELVDHKNAYDVFADCKNKKEELDFKEENMEQNETRRENEPCKRNITNQFFGESKSLKVRIYQCDQCVFQTKHRKSLWNHRIRHKKPEEVNIFKCDHCDYQTPHKQYLSNHMLRQLKNNNHYKTNLKDNLADHMFRHKNSEEVNVYKCDQCAYQTPHKRILTRHFRKHKTREEVDMFKCDQCSFETLWKSALKRHHLTHKNAEEVKMFKCDNCNYQTVRKGDLTIHMLRHENLYQVYTFKCDQCSYQTVHKRYLKQHSIGHKSSTEDDMFKCSQCHFETKRNKHKNLKTAN